VGFALTYPLANSLKQVIDLLWGKDIRDNDVFLEKGDILKGIVAQITCQTANSL